MKTVILFNIFLQLFSLLLYFSFCYADAITTTDGCRKKIGKFDQKKKNMYILCENFILFFFLLTFYDMFPFFELLKVAYMDEPESEIIETKVVKVFR